MSIFDPSPFAPLFRVCCCGRGSDPNTVQKCLDRAFDHGHCPTGGYEACVGCPAHPEEKAE